MQFSLATVTALAGGAMASSAGLSGRNHPSVGAAKQAESVPQQAVPRRALLLQHFLTHGMKMRPRSRRWNAEALTSMETSLRDENEHQPIPCVPTSKMSGNADKDILGVLSCGVGAYCAESDLSRLGGFCQSLELQHIHRKLQYCWNATSICANVARDIEYCDDYDQELPTCDCSSFRVTNGSGAISCEVPEYCVQVRLSPDYAPCQPTCFKSLGTVTYSATEDTSFTCQTFTLPYTQTLCRGYAQITMADNVVEKSCNISLDGVYCNSCTVANFQGTPQRNPLYFDTWDCTNIGLGASPTDGTFATRFLVDAPLIRGDPDCSKTDGPVEPDFTMAPTESPEAEVTAAPTVVVDAWTFPPSSLESLESGSTASSSVTSHGSGSMLSLFSWGTLFVMLVSKL